MTAIQRLRLTLVALACGTAGMGIACIKAESPIMIVVEAILVLLLIVVLALYMRI